MFQRLDKQNQVAFVDVSALILAYKALSGDCQEICVRAAIVDPKEVSDGTMQSTSYP